MRVLMLGWEFPPFISGGLGTACYGLTKALSQAGHEVTFVLPKSVDASVGSHVELVNPDSPPGAAGARAQGDAPQRAAGTRVGGGALPAAAGGALARVRFRGVPAAVSGAYASHGPGLGAMGETSAVVGAWQAAHRAGVGDVGAHVHALREAGVSEPMLAALVNGAHAQGGSGGSSSDYGGDVLFAAARYADMALALCRDDGFDVIHAHDWMTYPAGIALASATGLPLVIHVHSTEFDRSGEHVNQAIYDIERRGMHGANKVITVSYLTRSICERRYGVPGEKIRVVYNGVELDERLVSSLPGIEEKDKIVLFLGRITMQKGPEYFIAAAKRVLEKIEHVKFIVAGSGDMAQRAIELAAEMGIGHKVLFTGFLRGGDVARVFKMADCYVMPSVSEPFGIAPLEAMSHDVPVIISKQSGVSEVLTHALKVDFWDIDAMADKIIAVLTRPPLSRTLRKHGRLEVRRLTWAGAAEKCVQVYHEAAARRAGHGVGGLRPARTP